MISTPCLNIFITASCIVTFVCTTVSGVFFILAPEEPSLNFGGGAYYSLAIGIVLFLLALCTLFFGIFGCTSVARDSKHRLLLYTLFGFVLAGLTLFCVGAMFLFTYVAPIANNVNDTMWSHVLVAVPYSNDTMFDVQSKYHCCGVDNSSDWHNPLTQWYQHFNQIDPTLDIPYPESCYYQDRLVSEGCKVRLMKRLMLVVDVSFGLAIISSLLQLCTSCFTWYGNRIIKKYENYTIL